MDSGGLSMSDLTWEELDALVDTDPIRLRDAAWKSQGVANDLRDELSAVRDLAYRGTGSPTDALEAIHRRASRAIAGEAP